MIIDGDQRNPAEITQQIEKIVIADELKTIVA
jgi:hypothetical protein